MPDDFGYVYLNERPRLFTEEGQRLLLAVRDAAFGLIATAGAARASEVMDLAVKKLGAAGTWEMLAVLDRLVEIGDLYEVTDASAQWAQYRIFTRRGS
jgi:hypothetical protein